MTDSLAQPVPPLTAWSPTARLLRVVTTGNRAPVVEIACDGQRYAARRSQRSAAALTWELDLLAYLAAQGLRVPCIVRTQDGARSCDGWVLAEWLPGTPPETPAD
jgi:aminoglycoside phosphotransferase